MIKTPLTKNLNTKVIPATTGSPAVQGIKTILYKGRRVNPKLCEFIKANPSYLLYNWNKDLNSPTPGDVSCGDGLSASDWLTGAANLGRLYGSSYDVYKFPDKPAVAPKAERVEADFNEGWNASGWSRETIKGSRDVIIHFGATAETVGAIVGIVMNNVGRETELIPSQIHYGVYFSKGVARVFEQGKLFLPEVSATYTETDVFSIRCINRVITYLKNNVPIHVSTFSGLIGISGDYSVGGLLYRGGDTIL